MLSNCIEYLIGFTEHFNSDLEYQVEIATYCSVGIFNGTILEVNFENWNFTKKWYFSIKPFCLRFVAHTTYYFLVLQNYNFN